MVKVSLRVENIERGENLTVFETLESAMQHAEKQAAQ